MNYDIYKVYQDKKVCVGIPNWFDTTKLFYEVGTVLEVTNEYMVLRNDNGIRKIPLSDIMQIELYKESA
jgi:hypothetical protein